MEIQRKKNAKRNIVFGAVYKMYQIIIPFAMRTLMIYQLGMDYAGLNNLFTSIFQVLNLAELGIGAALTCSMYKPIADDDKEQICALLGLYKKCFDMIGLVVLFIGLFCVPLLRYLVKGSVPDGLNLLILYLLYLANTVLSYWLFAYKKSLLYAHQRNDIISKVMFKIATLQYLLQIYFVIFLKNYYLYLLASILAQILSNFILAMLTDRIYPVYKPWGTLEKNIVDEIKKKVQGLVMNKIGGTVLRSADSIVISAVLGLSVLAVYQNYYFILTAVLSMFSVIFEACVAGIGNSLIVESSRKNYRDLKNITFIVGWLLCVSCSCLISLYQPFMVMWVGEKNLLDTSLMVCFVVYFFLFEINQLVGMYKDAAGIWYADRYRPLLSSIANLIMNLILVQYIGLYGILLSTIIALLFFDLPWLLHNVFSSIFPGCSSIEYICILVKFGLCALSISQVTFFLCNKIVISGVLGIVTKLGVTLIVSDVILFMLFFKTGDFKNAKKIVLTMLKG